MRREIKLDCTERKKRRKSFAAQKTLQALAIPVSRQWRDPTLHMNHPGRTRTHRLLTMQPGSPTYCTFIRPLSIPIHFPPLQQPTHHAKPCQKKLIPFAKIPKPDEDKGLGVSWPAQETDMDALKAVFEDMKAKMWKEGATLVECRSGLAKSMNNIPLSKYCKENCLVSFLLFVLFLGASDTVSFFKI